MKRLAARLLLAARVRPSGRFLVRLLRRPPGARPYSIRATSQRILIRHDASDPYVLNECFGPRRGYRPPPALEARLGADPPRRVVDIGANIGLFGLLAFASYEGCEVVGFEPDPANIELHRACIEANGLQARWRLIPAAAAPAPGKLDFLAGRSARSRVVDSGEASTIEVEAVDAFEEIGSADLVKIDIEGGEWPLLADPRLAASAASAIVLEYHGAGCPGPDPRAAAEAALHAAGFQTEVTEVTSRDLDPLEGAGTLWAWR